MRSLRPPASTQPSTSIRGNRFLSMVKFPIASRAQAPEQKPRMDTNEHEFHPRPLAPLRRWSAAEQDAFNDSWAVEFIGVLKTGSPLG
jgi:hypothetical protein